MIGLGLGRMSVKTVMIAHRLGDLVVNILFKYTPQPQFLKASGY